MDPFVNIHLHDGTSIIFKQCRASLYYFDTTNEAFAEDQTIDYIFLNTVNSNKSCFHIREIKVADKAIILKQLVGWPSTQTLKESIQNNQIRNCPITSDDISRAEAIYGHQIPIIQFKAIRRIPEHHKTNPRILLPPIMAKHHQNMELAMNFFFVNESTFLHIN